MMIKLDTVLRDFEGEPLKADVTIAGILSVFNAVLAEATKENPELGARLEECAEELLANKKDLTLRNVIYLLSSSHLPETTTSERETLFTVAVNSIGQDELELKSEQAVILKKVVGQLFKSPLIQQQVILLVEGQDPFPKVRNA